MAFRRIVVGVALCMTAGVAHAAPFTVRGALVSVETDLGFVQQGVDINGTSVSINNFLGRGAVWEAGFSAIAESRPELIDALAGSTFLGGRSGILPPDRDTLSDSADVGTVGLVFSSIGGPLVIGDPDFRTGWIDGEVVDGHRSARATLNGVTGEYYWVGQLIVPAGEEIRPLEDFDVSINGEVSENTPTRASAFARTDDGSLFASFDRLGETFWWTVLNEGTVDGNDVYRVYLSDVQVIPAPGALVLLLASPIALRRRR